MRKDSVCVVMGTPHRLREPGKQDPVGRLKECVYGREIVSEVAAALHDMGYRCIIDYTPLDLPKYMQTDEVKLERQRELNMRVKFVNEVCDKYGARNVLYVSVHVNASGCDGQWHYPHGWSVVVCQKASKESMVLADCLYDAANAYGLHMRQPAPQQKYWEQDLYVLTKTKCPAVLTENLFQDNRVDVEFLLSEEGRHIIERLHVEGIIKYIESL